MWGLGASLRGQGMLCLSTMLTGPSRRRRPAAVHKPIVAAWPTTACPLRGLPIGSRRVTPWGKLAPGRLALRIRRLCERRG